MGTLNPTHSLTHCDKSEHQSQAIWKPLSQSPADKSVNLTFWRKYENHDPVDVGFG